MLAAPTATATAKGPSPGQRIRRGELLAEKANCSKQFTPLNTKIRASKGVAERAVAQYEKDKEEKRQLEEKYSKILAELGRIPAELSSSGGGGVMLTSGRDIVKNRKGEEVTIKEGRRGTWFDGCQG